MANKQVDVAIIGVGSAGMRAYKAALKYTTRIAAIEGNQFGTTCARVGCMPSKLLISPAEAAHRTHIMPQFGITVGDLNIDGKAVMKRVRDERDRFVGFVQEAVDHYNPDHVIRAYATFKDNHTLTLSNGDEIQADRIVIATGSTPKIPDIFKGLGRAVITSDDVFYWDDLPESVAVIGAGVIGLELGQALSRLGVRVKVFGRNNRLGTLSDPEVSQYAIETFQREFDYLSNSCILNAKALNTNDLNDGVEITFQANTASTEISTEQFQYVLVAAGRNPNVEKLALSNTNLTLDENGTPVFNPLTMQCGDSSIFIAGDASDELELLHEAVDEGAMAGSNAGSYPVIKEFTRKTPLTVLFTDPQIAIAGQSFKQLTESKQPFISASADFEDQGRSRVMLVNKGLMKLYAEPETGKLLGSEMMGPSHEHLAHLLAWSIQQNLTVEQILQFPFYHPTIEEGMEDGLEELQERLQQ